VRFLARRAFNLPCRTRRRIFIDRRLSRLPMRSQYCFGGGLSSRDSPDTAPEPSKDRKVVSRKAAC
jgi:hypothetical protein